MVSAKLGINLKGPAEVFIKHPDGSETRVIRRKKGVVQQRNDVDLLNRDEEREMVYACPPYTASFNAMLKERKEKNSRALVNAVLERMHAESIPLNVITYNSLLERVVGASDDIAFELYDEIREDSMCVNSNVQPDLTTYQLLFRACERKSQYHRAFHLYMQMREMPHIVPDTTTYDTLLGFCAAVKDVPQALFFMEEMKKNCVAPSVNTYNCLMGALREKAPYEETLRVYNGMTEWGVKPTVRTFNTVTGAALIHDDYEMAFQLFEEMKKQGVLPNVVSYNTLLCLVRQRLDYVMGRNAYASVKRTREQQAHGMKAISELTTTLFHEMGSMVVEPNTFTFNLVMEILIECDDFGVFDIYRMMQEHYNKNNNKTSIIEEKIEATRMNVSIMMAEASLSLDSNKIQPRERNPSIDSILCSIDVNKDTSNAANLAGLPSLDVIMGMDNRKRSARITANEMQPNVDTYRLIVRACLHFGFAKHCHYFYNAMLNEGLGPDYNFALLMETVCEEIRDVEKAFAVLSHAKMAGVYIDVSLFNAYLRVLAAVGDDKLLSILGEMELGINSFCSQPDVETYNIVLRYHLGLKHYDAVVELFDSMYDSYRQVRPNADTYLWMLQTHRAMNDVEAATQLLESMHKRQIPVDIQHYHELMRVYVQAGDERLLQVFQQLQNGDDGEYQYPKVDVICFSLVMEYYVRLKEWDKLDALFHKLLGYPDMEADVNCYNIMFDMCLLCGKYVEAKSLFNELRMKCVKPDLRMYNTLLHIFAAAADSAMYEVLETMRMNHVAPEASTLSILLQYAEGRHLVSDAVARNLFWDPTTDLKGLL